MLPKKRRESARESAASSPKLPKTVGQIWEITNFLGQGSFGAIYKGVKLPGAPSVVGNRPVPKEVAIKFESLLTPWPQLISEKNIIKMLHSPSADADPNNKNQYTSNGTYINSDLNGFPDYYYFGIESGHYCLAMTLLGPSLYSLFEQKRGRNWTYCTVAPLGIQMLDRIELFHKKGHIHRDIKPDNFLLGARGNRHTVTMIDFGLAKTYRTSSGAHQPAVEGKNLTGTARYASINAHQGMEQSRRDDLEALMYCLLFLLLGKLPWQGLKPNPRQTEKYSHILKVKREIQMADLCRPSGSTEVFRCLKEVRAYAYNQRPRYGWLRNNLIAGLIQRIPIYRCIKTNADGSVSVNLARINDPYGIEKVPIPDWQRSKEWVNSALLLEQKFMVYNGMRVPAISDQLANNIPCIAGFPGETIDLREEGERQAAAYKRTYQAIESQPQQNQLASNTPVHVLHRGTPTLASQQQAETNMPITQRQYKSPAITGNVPRVVAPINHNYPQTTSRMLSKVRSKGNHIIDRSGTPSAPIAADDYHRSKKQPEVHTQRMQSNHINYVEKDQVMNRYPSTALPHDTGRQWNFRGEYF